MSCATVAATALAVVAGAEAFTWGRFDVDGRVAMQFFSRNLEVAVKGLAVGMAQPGARYLSVAEVRWRFFAERLYALSTGGTLLHPEVDGTLRPGAFASFGLGWTMLADFLLPRWRGLLLAYCLLATGCVSLTPPPGRGMNPSDTPPVADSPTLAQRLSDERSRPGFPALILAGT